jgi:23S rRNA (adenine2503-C2)-methyltransferase
MELMGKSELLGKSKEELRELCATWGEPAYRAAQIYRALYAERKFDVFQITNLPASLRAKLSETASITFPEIKQRFQSVDGSVRYLFDLGSGAQPMARPTAVESVFMPRDGRQTICVSTQAGCAVNCQFCLTAKLGLIRNLSAGEIIAQILLPLEEHKLSLEPQTNIVFMGQGEPLLNFEAVIAAADILLDQQGLGLSPRHVTISTSGIVPGIERLGKESVRPQLAISLNASSDEQRDALMPINRKYPLKLLLEACREYPLRKWEYLMFEYVMLGNVNDSPEDAKRVVRLLNPLKAAKVNLIPWNPGALPYSESTPERIEAFQKILIERGVPTFVRYSRGRDVMAACGQLALLDSSANSAANLVSLLGQE